MADVTFLQNGQSTTVQASDDGSQSILDIALKNGINMDHACGGNVQLVCVGFILVRKT
jgi:ferredoxin